MDKDKGQTVKGEDALAEVRQHELLDPLVGNNFESRYRVISKLGSGASGVAYKADDIILQRTVVLKLIHAHLLHSERAVARFKTEASLSTKLSHPNIVRVYSQGVSADGKLYMVMDFLEGESLADLLKREGRLSLPFFFDIFSQLIEALIYAHAEGVIHRDIKPNNILISPGEVAPDSKRAFLLDFGVAKWIDQDSGQGATQTGALLGSSSYMSPEQCMGASDIDSSSDIYSLGCVMLESLVGKAPFEGESALDVMYKHLNESVSRLGVLKEMPEALSKLITKCLQKEKSLRYQNMEELKKDFLRCSEMQDSLKSGWRRPKLFSRKEKIIAGSVVFLGVVGAVSAGIWQTQKLLAGSPDRVIDKKAERSAENVSVPLKKKDLEGLVFHFREMQNLNGALTVLNRWLQQYDRLTDIKDEDRFAAYAQLSIVQAELGNEKISRGYMDKVIRSSCAPTLAAHCLAALSELYRRRAEPEKAIALIEKTKRSYPRLMDFQAFADETNGTLASCYMSLSDYEKAVRILKELVDGKEANFDNAWKYMLITALLKCGRKSEAKALIADYVSFESRPKHKLNAGLVYRSIAEACCSGDDLDESLKYFLMARDAFIETGKSAQANACRTRATSILRESNRFEEALKLESQALKSESWQQTASRFIALSHDSLALNQTGAAKKQAELAVKVCEDLLSSCTQAELCGQDANIVTGAVCRMRDLLNREGKEQEAQAFMREWQERVRRKGNSLALALIILNEGYTYAHQRNHLEALRCFETAQSILSDSHVQELMIAHGIKPCEIISDALCLKVHIFQNEGNFAESVAAARSSLDCLNECSSIQDKILNAELTLAYNLVLAGKKDEARLIVKGKEQTWNRIHMNWDLACAEQMKKIAEIASQIGESERAVKILRSCIDGLAKRYANKKTVPLEYYHDLGTALISVNRPLDARRVFNEALTLHSAQQGDSWYLATLRAAWDACVRTNDYDAALNYLNQYIELCKNGTPLRVYLDLADTYRLAKDESRAREAVERGLEAAASMKVPSPRELCKLRLRLARALLEENDLERLQKTLSLALAASEEMKDPSQRYLHKAIAYKYYAKTYLKEKDPEKACGSYRQSVEMFKKSGQENEGALKRTLELWREAAVIVKDSKGQLNEIEQELSILKSKTAASDIEP